MKAPNEKLTETLFTLHALRYLENYGGGSVYTPSTREEYSCGYDSRLMGVRVFSELYLQFKTPNLLSGNDYGFRATLHQHERLQAYPPNTAYYLTHLFRGIREIQNAERTATDSLDFLRWYVAIEIKCLVCDLRRFRYTGDLARLYAENVFYNRETARKRTQPKTPLQSSWLSGAELLEQFAKDEVGARVILAEDSTDALNREPVARLGDRGWVMFPGKANDMVREDEGTDWGTALRKPERHSPEQVHAQAQSDT